MKKLLIIAFIVVTTLHFYGNGWPELLKPYVPSVLKKSDPQILITNTPPTKVTTTYQSTPNYINNGNASPFSCDGRTHCSQMKSCDEAKFFLKNCPNTKMDGNGDGIPCERQHCY